MKKVFIMKSLGWIRKREISRSIVARFVWSRLLFLALEVEHQEILKARIIVIINNRHYQK